MGTRPLQAVGGGTVFQHPRFIWTEPAKLGRIEFDRLREGRMLLLALALLTCLIGAWRSLVARLPWAQEVPSSNLGAPTKILFFSLH